MTRPPEYETLVGRGSLKAAAADPLSIAQFMRVAQQMQTTVQTPLPDAARFVLAYDGMFNVVMVILEFHETRPGDTAGHRATAIQRVAADLHLAPAKFSALTRLHDARNRVTYRSAIPPITKADADAMQMVLDDFLLAGSRLLGSRSS